jgi:hypothetical protein
MKPEIKEKWVERLNDPATKQGDGKLRGLGDDYCCLGVLCQLAVEAGIGKWEPDITCYAYVVEDDQSTAFLVQRVIDWAGLPLNMADVLRVDSAKVAEDRVLTEEEYAKVSWGSVSTPSGISLIGLNDQGVPFSIIAKLINKYL